MTATTARATSDPPPVVRLLWLAIALASLAFYLDEQLVAVGLADELVAPDVQFERLRIGDAQTCVTLRRASPATGRWRSRETCYKMFPDKKDPGTTIRDLETGVELVLKSVCEEEDDEWVASKLGIPARLPVVEIWQKQCQGWRIGSGSAQVLTIAAVLALGLCLQAEHDSERLSVGPSFLILPALVLSCLPMLIWQHVLWDSSFDAGRSHSLWKWAIALLFSVSFLRGFVAPIVWATTPHAEQTAEAADTSESASDDQEQHLPTEEEQDETPTEEEQDEPETAGDDEKAKCDCHYHSCKCGKEVLLLWKRIRALLFFVSILRGFLAPIVWAASPHTGQTAEAAVTSESASDGQERRGGEENDQQLPSEQEQGEPETAGGDEKAKCDCHYHCCKCGKEVLSSALKRRYRRPQRASRRLRVLLRKREERAVDDSPPSAVKGDDRDSDDWDQVDAPQDGGDTGIRQRHRYAGPPRVPT
ncbi:hypothetical protein P43SY_002847 [Pythium insidiosum]|uniref:Transmembrane protein n=1 Tax=Pythium insidiosum TaxID=114742 RepID=A0AAD5LSH2_PYTIN|nr:hypothetical protein P43SY_002847 [Pythium insidiosum]